MKHFLRCAAVALCLLAVFSGCGKKETQSEAQTKAKLNETLHTMFFDYTVESASRTDLYAEHKAQDGSVLIQLRVTVQNTFASAIPMKDADFRLYWGTDEAQAAWPADALNEAMMPLEYELAPGQTASYDMVFPVPAEQTDFRLVTQDLYRDSTGAENKGTVYEVAFSA